MNPQPARKSDNAKRPKQCCRDEVTLIGDYLIDNLNEAQRQAFETHLSACSDCGAFLATYKKTIALTRSFLRAGIVDQPSLELRRP